MYVCLLWLHFKIICGAILESLSMVCNCNEKTGKYFNMFFFFSKLGVRSLANASRARQFYPLNPPGVGWVPLPQTNMAAVVGRAWSCVRGRSCVVVCGRAWSVVRGRSCVVVRGRSCVVVPFCPLRGQHGSQHCRDTDERTNSI